jgi:hypothetical protein
VRQLHHLLPRGALYRRNDKVRHPLSAGSSAHFIAVWSEFSRIQMTVGVEQHI